MNISDFSPQQQHLLSLMADLNKKHQWGLSRPLQEQYINDLMQMDDVIKREDQDLQGLIADYHLVKVLRNDQDPNYEAAWESWMREVIPILKHASLWRINDGISDLDDIAQIAREAVIRSLPKFQFKSRFSTWVFQVITRSVRRAIRDAEARKRAQRPESLDAIQEGRLAGSSEQQLHNQVDLKLLHEMALEILSKHPDQRLPIIFTRMLDDETITDLAPKLAISSQRVRALLKQIRKLLSEDPRWREWFESDEDSNE